MTCIELDLGPNICYTNRKDLHEQRLGFGFLKPRETSGEKIIPTAVPAVVFGNLIPFGVS